MENISVTGSVSSSAAMRCFSDACNSISNTYAETVATRSTGNRKFSRMEARILRAWESVAEFFWPTSMRVSKISPGKGAWKGPCDWLLQVNVVPMGPTINLSGPASKFARYAMRKRPGTLDKQGLGDFGRGIFSSGKDGRRGRAGRRVRRRIPAVDAKYGAYSTESSST